MPSRLTLFYPNLWVWVGRDSWDYGLDTWGSGSRNMTVESFPAGALCDLWIQGDDHRVDTEFGFSWIDKAATRRFLTCDWRV
jgi:hypothetical protein